MFEKATTIYLDLPTLLASLQSYSSAIVQSVFAQGIPPHMPEPCTAELHVERGNVTLCVLQSQRQPDKRIQGAFLLRHLQKHDEWTITIQQSGLASNQQITSHIPITGALRIPRRAVAALDRRRLGHLPTQKRFLLQTVFALIDGKRNVGEIHKLLQLRPETIEDLLATLQESHLIRI